MEAKFALLALIPAIFVLVLVMGELIMNVLCSHCDIVTHLFGCHEYTDDDENF